jgi:hypothetical protein
MYSLVLEYDGPFGTSFSHIRVGPREVAATDLYWPVVENYIGVVQTAVREAASPTLPQEAEKTEKVIKEVAALAEGLKE